MSLTPRVKRRQGAAKQVSPAAAAPSPAPEVAERSEGKWRLVSHAGLAHYFLPAKPPSRTTIWRWIRAGKFPKPIPFTPSTYLWPEEALESWRAALVASHQPGGA